jgi:hypothetical protein
MLVFTWIVLGIVALFLVLSGVCWLLFILLDDARWKQLGVKVFRWSLVGVLFYINGVIWRHLADAV